LSSSQPAIIGAALDAMADTRGDLPPGLERLRGAFAQIGS